MVGYDTNHRSPSSAFLSASHAARCVACQGVDSHPVPVALVVECFMLADEVARQKPALTSGRRPSFTKARAMRNASSSAEHSGGVTAMNLYAEVSPAQEILRLRRQPRPLRSQRHTGAEDHIHAVLRRTDLTPLIRKDFGVEWTWRG